MRSPDIQQGKLFYYVSPERRIPKKHPLRPIKDMANACLRTLTAEFSKMYSPIGRPSIPPERLLKALLLQVLYSIRSERALVEHLDYNLLFRWFVGLSPDDPVWDPSSFSKNRDRLIEADIAMEFLEKVIAMAEGQGLISKEHFTVDGTLLEAWASVKSFKPKGSPPPDDPGAGGGRNEAVDFHGEKRSNETHASKTDPEALLAKKGKGKEAKLCYTGHALMENRSGLVVNAQVTRATGTCEREAASEMLEESVDHVRATIAADKSYDCKEFVRNCRNRQITPHVAQKKHSAIDGRYHAASRLRCEYAGAQAGGGGLCLGEDHRLPSQGAPPGCGESLMGFHLRRSRIQSGAHAKSWCSCCMVMMTGEGSSLPSTPICIRHRRFGLSSRPKRTTKQFFMMSKSGLKKLSNKIAGDK